MCQWRTKQRHRCVAYVFVDGATVLGHDFVGTCQEPFNDAMSVFCAQSRRKLGKAANIGEQDHDLPPLGLRRCLAGGNLVAKVGDRFEKSLPVSERGDTQLPQILDRQTAKSALIDVIGDK